MQKELDEQLGRNRNNLEPVELKTRLRKTESGMINVQNRIQEAENGKIQLSAELVELRA